MAVKTFLVSFEHEFIDGDLQLLSINPQQKVL